MESSTATATSFPELLVIEARASLFSELGINAIQLGEDDSKLGGVETHADARKCAELFLRHSGVPAVAVGISAGASYGAIDSTHHSLLDLAAPRAINNLTILAPADKLRNPRGDSSWTGRRNSTPSKL